MMLYTRRQIADRIGCHPKRVSYAIDRAGILPTATTGSTPLFNQQQADEIVTLVCKAIGRRPTYQRGAQ